MKTLTFQSKFVCNVSLEPLLLCVFILRQKMLMHELFFLTQNLSWPINVELLCWHFGIHGFRVAV